MTLQDSFNFFEDLKSGTMTKAEARLYEKFSALLSALKLREFSKQEMQSIETELESLELKSLPKNRKKHYSKALIRFEKYLRDELSLISKGYYTKLYGGLGLSFGILFGVVILSSWERSLGISLGLLFGMVIGTMIGQSMDTKAKKENRVL